MIKKDAMNLLISILLCYGMTNIIVNGSIFEPIRNWLGGHADNFFIAKLFQLVSCMMCSGFWVGALVGWFYGPFVYWNILFHGCLYSGAVWLIHCLANTLGQGYDPSKVINIVIDQPIEITNKEETNDNSED